MAVTPSNVRKESVGSLWCITGDFTSANGDTGFTFEHGFNYVASDEVDLSAGGVGTQNPKITHSAGTATVTFDNTLGYSGKFKFIGK